MDKNRKMHIEEFIKSPFFQPGNMIHSQIIIPDVNKNEPAVAFVIMEEMKRLKKLPKKPICEIRTGILAVKNVKVVPILIKFNDIDDTIYESFLNYHSSDIKSRELFWKLTKQDHLYVMLYDEHGEKHRILEIPNTIKEDSIKLHESLKEEKEWSMSEFDKAKQNIFDIFPGFDDLWKELD